jgi:hypothetical protein
LRIVRHLFHVPKEDVMKSAMCLFGILCGSLALLRAGTAEVLPARTGVGGLLYSSFPYRTAWDGDGSRQNIGTTEIQQFNAMLGADLVGGSYQADYDFFTFDLMAGLTDRTTLRMQLPYFESEVRQRVDVYAPQPMEGMIRSQLDAMDFRTETLTGDGWGDVNIWIYHQYFSQPERLKLMAGLGWRTPAIASRFSQNTEKLNVGTREAETALFTHNADLRLTDALLLNHRLEYQHPFEGDKDVFVPGIGVVNLPYTPGWQLTQQVELITEWFERRVHLSAGVWYRDEGADEVDGNRSGCKDALWFTGALGYNGLKDYEDGVLPLPVFTELRYWYLEEARNFRAYYDSYWEFWIAVPLWSW